LTFPFSWRRRLAQDGALLGRLTAIFAETVHAFYAERVAKEGWSGAKTGSVTFLKRTSSDLRLNPHLHLVALDGAYHEQGAELAGHALGHLKTSEGGEVLERAVRRIEKHLRRRGLLVGDDGADTSAEGDADPESNLAASAVSGQAPPAGRRSASSFARRRRAHRPEEGVHRRNRRGRHGPVVAALPAGQQRPPLRGSTP
jgi:hypothetical protein